VVDDSNELPEEMTSFVRLLMMSVPEWEKAKGKSKLPKPKVDDAVLSVVADVVRRRLGEYPTTLEASLPDAILSFNVIFVFINVSPFRMTKVYSERKRRSPSR
jgi:hypothetical protein